MPVVYSRKRIRELQQRRNQQKEQQGQQLSQNSVIDPSSLPQSNAALSIASRLPSLPTTATTATTATIATVSKAENNERKVIKKKPLVKKRKKSFIQTHIDVGQHDISSRQCKECKMIYSPGAQNDNLVHAKYHMNYVRKKKNEENGIKYNPILNEKIIATTFHSILANDSNNQGKFICIKCTDDEILKNYLYEIDKIITLKLSSSDKLSLNKQHKNWLVVLYVINNFIKAYLLTEIIHSVSIAKYNNHHVVVNHHNSNDRMNGLFCGVRKMWVHHSLRRLGIASKMVDVARLNLVYGVCIEKKSVAFTPTTLDGSKFAFAYTNQTISSSNSRIFIYSPSSLTHNYCNINEETFPTDSSTVLKVSDENEVKS